MKILGEHSVCIELPNDINKMQSCCDYINNNEIFSITLDLDNHSLNSNCECLNLEFINLIKTPQKITELLIYGKFKNLSCLYLLSQVKELKIYTLGVDIDLSKFALLETLQIGDIPLKFLKNLNLTHIRRFAQFDGVFDASIIEQLQNLKSLIFHEVKNLDITKLKSDTLEYLSITQCKIYSLRGIEQLKNLDVLDIAYCRSLRDISSIIKLEKLRIIEIESCNGILNVEVIGQLPNLVTLWFENMSKCDFNFISNLHSAQSIRCILLENCGKISSIKFIDSYKSMEAFCAFDTNIEDGDLTPLLRMQSADVTDKHHYNLNSKQLPYDKAFIHWFYV